MRARALTLRRLGATGPPVSAIGLGLAALGRPGYLNLGHGEDMGAQKSVAALEARAHAVLDAAWARGVRYFDVAAGRSSWRPGCTGTAWSLGR